MSLSRRRLPVAAAVALAVAGTGTTAALATARHGQHPARSGHLVRSADVRAHTADAGTGHTITPIKHLVVIFQENVSFDHYFGTYPHAANPAGEPSFTAAPGTPSVNGLTPGLLTHNPNESNPQRLDRSQAVTCDQDHNYSDEQSAFDHGLMDKFVQDTGRQATVQQCTGQSTGTAPNYAVMDYYDGNTVTGLWNYAQHYALNDNSYGTTFGPSTPGALNLISGQTHGATAVGGTTGNIVGGTETGDNDPAYDDCSGGTKVAMSGQNIGDLLNKQGTTWGWFEGGFKPTSTTGGTAVCGSAHANIAGGTPTADYVPHHEPFQYYASTANPHHLPPSSVAMIGHTDQANHQYDLSDFWASVDNGNMPSVSFLKAPAYEDGHAGYSDPIDEQHFLVDTINRLEHSKDWSSTAVVINYDDSDGWYDHQMSTILNQSTSSADTLTDPGQCGSGASALGGYQGRCGYGPRLPLMVISPYAKVNKVDSTLTDQSSILKFIEDNWSTGQIGDGSFDSIAGPLTNMFNFGSGPRAAPLYLNPQTGEPVSRGQSNQQ